MEQNLQQSGLILEQLKAQLSSRGITNLEQIMLAMITPDGQLYIDKRNDG